MTDAELKLIVEAYPEWIKYPFDDLYTHLGFERLHALSRAYGGTTLYIPTARRMFGKCLALHIRGAYDGSNARHLAEQYGFCSKTIRAILDG